MLAVREALEDCNLSDLSYTGDRFTWPRGMIRERLDREISNNKWNDMFSVAKLEHLEYHKSDHRHVLLSLEAEQAQEHNVPSVLRFEAKWLKENRFREVMEEAWQTSDTQIQTSDLA